MSRTTRAFLWSIVAIGLALIVIPFAIGLPRKASAGQTLLDDLRPMMRPASVTKTVNYYDNTFVQLRPVAVGAVQAAGEAPKLVAALATPLHLTPAGVQQFLATSFPAMANLIRGLPQLAPVFAQVPPGLEHYQPLVRAIQGNVDNYASVDSLPNLRLFTWFMVIPGALLVLLAGGSVVTSRRERIVAVPAPAS
jgi:hypothetical protein